MSEQPPKSPSPDEICPMCDGTGWEGGRKLSSGANFCTMCSAGCKLALAVLRDPDGTGRTKVSHGFGGNLKPVKR